MNSLDLISTQEIILTKKDQKKLAKDIKNPPKANKALRELLKEIKKRNHEATYNRRTTK